MCIIEDICGYTEEVAYTIFFSLLLGNLGVRWLKAGSSLWLSCVLRNLCSSDSSLSCSDAFSK